MTLLNICFMDLKRFEFLSGMVLGLMLLVSACAKNSTEYYGSEVKDWISLKGNIPVQGDTCWFSVDFRYIMTKAGVVREYVPVSYRLVIGGENYGETCRINGPDDISNTLSMHPEYARYWRHRYGTDIPDNVVFIIVPGNESGKSRTVRLETSVGSAGEWNALFDVVQDAEPGLQEPVTVQIPREFQNPVANLMVFDIDKGGQCTIISDGGFTFEIVSAGEYNDKDRTPSPVTSYSDGWISMNMTGDSKCELIVHVQERPYTSYSKAVIFYRPDLSVIETDWIEIGEGYSNMDWESYVP